MRLLITISACALFAFSFTANRQSNGEDNLQTRSIFEESKSYIAYLNKSFKFSDHADKVLLLCPWEHWCMGSEDLKDELNAIKGKVNSSKLLIVAVGMSMDGVNNRKGWQDFIKENNWTDCQHILVANSLQDPVAKMIYYKDKVVDGQQYYMPKSNSFFIVGKDGFGRPVSESLSPSEMAREIKKEF